MKAVVTTGAALGLVMAAPVHAQLRDVAGLSLEQLGNVEITSVSRRPDLLNARHLEANDPSTYPPQYVPQSLLLTVRQRI